MRIKIYKRPRSKKLRNDICNIVGNYTESYFTKEVKESIDNDLKYPDIICILQKKHLIGFLEYTSFDGKICIILMAVDPNYANNGIGKQLIQKLVFISRLQSFKKVFVQTVPDTVNTNYKATINFYESVGFRIVKTYTELWEHGAIELEMEL
jgi:Acetyltransferases